MNIDIDIDFDDLPPLEERCRGCFDTADGRRMTWVDGELVICPECGGRGTRPTAFGRAVLDFVRRRLGPGKEAT